MPIERVYVNEKDQVVAAPDPNEARPHGVKAVPACSVCGQPLNPKYAHMKADRSGALCTEHHAEDFAAANEGATIEPSEYFDEYDEPLPDNILRLAEE